MFGDDSVNLIFGHFNVCNLFLSGQNNLNNRLVLADADTTCLGYLYVGNGYTYHIEAEMDAYGRRNAFMITSETDNANVESLIKEVYKELRRLVDEPIPEAEVELVRNYILGELCREYEERFAKSEVFINAWLSGESFESVNKYLETVRGVAVADLQRVAKEVLDRNEMIEIVVGE